MTHPIPPGTRDVLPEEMRELRAIGERMRSCSSARDTARSTRRRSSTRTCCAAATSAPPAPRYRTFDEHGEVLALRSDVTIPIARVVATRYADAEPPLRFCYFAHAWRAVDSGVGEPREFLQGGLELIGIPGAEGEAEVVALASAALDEAGPAAPPRGRGRQLALPPAADRVRRARGEPYAAAQSAVAARPRGPRVEVTRAGPGRRRARPAGGAARAPRGPEVLDRADGPAAGRRGPARAARAAGRARAWPTG